jgi:hypothetical protein
VPVRKEADPTARQVNIAAEVFCVCVAVGSGVVPLPCTRVAVRLRGSGTLGIHRLTVLRRLPLVETNHAPALYQRGRTGPKSSRGA